MDGNFEGQAAAQRSPSPGPTATTVQSGSSVSDSRSALIRSECGAAPLTKSVIVSGNNPHLLRADLHKREKRGQLTQITAVRQIDRRTWGAVVFMHKLPWSTRRRVLVTAVIATPVLAALSWGLLLLLRELMVLLPMALGGVAILAMILALLSRDECHIEVIHRRN